MGKRENHFETIEKVKERLKDISTETLRLQLTAGSLTKAGAVARRELIAERELAEKQGTNSNRAAIDKFKLT